MEELFGVSFAAVRLHECAEAASLGARAFAFGEDVYLGPGAFDLETPAGLWLLRHELAHVEQQRRSPAGNRGAEPEILSDALLEAEAGRWELAGGPGTLGVTPAPVAPVIQCTVLRFPLKQALYELLERLVKQMTPEEIKGYTDLGASSLDGYVDAVLGFLRANPYVFSGEKHQLEKLSRKKAAQTPIYIESGARVDIKLLDRGDWAWIRRTVKHFAQKHRFGQQNYVQTTTRIVPEYDDHQWLNWESTDCVFTAILIVLGMRFKGQSAQVQKAELDVEIELARYLEMPRTVVQDESVVWLLEQRLGWERMKAGTLRELLACSTGYVGRQFVISACQNPTTDFWHTVIGTRKATTWQIIDRQWERKFGTEGALPGDPDREANAWLVKADAPLIGTLKNQLNVANLKTKYSAYLEK